MTVSRIPSVEGGIQPTILTTKGDLISATAASTVNRLAVGSNDQVLVADSAASTGLAWKSYGAQFVAGKNKILNSDFSINQRSFSSTTTDGAYGFDRFKLISSAGGTMSAQTFTPGTAPVSGYEAINFCRIVTTGQSGAGVYSMLEQDIEDVRTFAGQTATISFWAKAASGTPKIAVEIFQQFGSGGSPSATVETYVAQATLTTSWARYTTTIAVPSISGKTIGTTANTSYLGIRLWVSAGTSSNSVTGSLGIQSNTFDMWGIQVESGSVATPFTTATGTIQGELAACQRYYWRFIDGSNQWISTGSYFNAGQLEWAFRFPIIMRTAPTLVISTGTDYYSFSRNSGTDSFNSITLYQATTQSCLLYNASEVSGTAGQAGTIFSNNASSSVALSAEL
jgi:hypothetical protein